MTLLMRDRENQKIGKEIGKIFGAFLLTGIYAFQRKKS